MGGKITIDSATLMNKGLELIEAHHLFGLPYEQIEVVVHPQSIIHSLISLCDGATLAHLGYPDMRVPISFALNHPERVDVPVAPLDLIALGQLTFESADEETFACLRLAREAALAGGTAPCTLNAANEVAVHAFMREQDRLPGHRRGDRADAVGAARRARPLVRCTGGADQRAREVAGELISAAAPPRKRRRRAVHAASGLPAKLTACPMSTRSWASRR